MVINFFMSFMSYRVKESGLMTSAELLFALFGSIGLVIALQSLISIATSLETVSQSLLFFAIKRTLIPLIDVAPTRTACDMFNDPLFTVICPLYVLLSSVFHTVGAVAVAYSHT